MNNEKNINAARAAPPPVRGNERPALIKEIGKTTYRVIIHFSTTSSETMSEKIKRMLQNEIKQM